MKKLLCRTTALLLILILIASTIPAYGEGCREAKAVKTPCEGVLLPTEAAKKAAQCITVDLPRLQVNLDYTKQVCSLSEAHLRSLLTLEEDENKLLQDNIKRLMQSQETSWYEHPVFLVGSGFAVGMGAAITLAVLLKN